MCPKKLSKLLILFIEFALLIVVRASCGIDGLKRRVVYHTIYEGYIAFSIFKEVYNFIGHVVSYLGK